MVRDLPCTLKAYPDEHTMSLGMLSLVSSATPWSLAKATLAPTSRQGTCVESTRARARVGEWESIESPGVLISRSCVLSLSLQPVQYTAANNQKARTNTRFIMNSITEMKRSQPWKAVWDYERNQVTSYKQAARSEVKGIKKGDLIIIGGQSPDAPKGEVIYDTEKGSK